MGGSLGPIGSHWPSPSFLSQVIGEYAFHQMYLDKAELLRPGYASFISRSPASNGKQSKADVPCLNWPKEGL